ncbi:MAG: hypothetical protein KGJ23_16305 [Euryarchaeota archaeon]|nr:hypothetical protein [Euryarchaeota archaeon]MDE1838160.1 hypothetical protein [Euryarchaeota archaeon]MDE2046708.1 hypothetical protein [Thermoplasmata archaeon]
MKRATMKLPEDPVTWVFQNPHADAILRAVGDGHAHLPLEVRKSRGIHPESFRKTVHTLAGYDLVRIRAQKGARFHETPRGYGIEVVLEATPKGLQVLEILEEFRSVLKRREPTLARATRERWLAP